MYEKDSEDDGSRSNQNCLLPSLKEMEVTDAAWILGNVSHQMKGPFQKYLDNSGYFGNEAFHLIFEDTH